MIKFLVIPDNTATYHPYQAAIALASIAVFITILWIAFRRKKNKNV